MAFIDFDDVAYEDSVSSDTYDESEALWEYEAMGCDSMAKATNASVLIVVLNDGETYTDIEGCRVVRLSNELDSEDIEEALKDAYYDGTEILQLLPGHFDLIK